MEENDIGCASRYVSSTGRICMHIPPRTDQLRILWKNPKLSKWRANKYDTSALLQVHYARNVSNCHRAYHRKFSKTKHSRKLWNWMIYISLLTYSGRKYVGRRFMYIEITVTRIRSKFVWKIFLYCDYEQDEQLTTYRDNYIWRHNYQKSARRVKYFSKENF
jgi:hypothetical protein